MNIKKIAERTHCLKEIDTRCTEDGVFLYYHSNTEPDLFVSIDNLDLSDSCIDYKTFYQKCQQFSCDKSSYLENVYLPPFEKLFTMLIMHYRRIPKPEEFVQAFVNIVLYFDHLDDFGQPVFYLQPWADSGRAERANGTLPKDKTIHLSDVYARICKNYPSFVREIFFQYHMIEESKRNQLPIHIFRDSRNDIQRDCDVACIFQNCFTSISMYNDTPYGNQKRSMKEQMRQQKQIQEYCHIILPTRLQMNHAQNSNTYLSPSGLELYTIDSIRNVLYHVVHCYQGLLCL